MNKLIELKDLIKEKIEERRIYKEAIDEFHEDDFTDED